MDDTRARLIRGHEVERSAGGGPSALDIWAFVLPATLFFEVTAVGRMIVVEVLLALMLPWLWKAPDRPRLPRWIVLLWAGWLATQVATDLLIGSAFEDWSRGWSGIVFGFTDIAAILVLAGTAKRVRIAAMGLAVGGILTYLVVGNPLAAGDPWKFAIAFPSGLLLASAVSGARGAHLRWLTIVAFLSFGAVNIVLGYRSLGGISLLTAGYLLLQALHVGRGARNDGSMRSGKMGLAVVVVGGLGVLLAYDLAASQGLLGADAQAKYRDQSGAYGVLVGGRSEFLGSVQAVMDSPILGHGSYGKDFKYVDLRNDELIKLGYAAWLEPNDVGLIPTHSHLLQAWVWSGVLGGLFWASILALGFRLLARLYQSPLVVGPLLAFSTLWLLWNVAFSPYLYQSRLVAAFGIALCVVGLNLIGEKRRVDKASTSGGPRFDRLELQRKRGLSDASDEHTGAALDADPSDQRQGLRHDSR